MQFKIALLQLSPEEMNQDHNLTKGLEWCRTAKALGADLALFPEMWNIGYAMCPFDAHGKAAWEASAIDRQSPFFQEFVRLAQALQMHIALSYLETYQPLPRNSVSIITPTGDVALTYSKVFICNFGTEELSNEKPDVDLIGCDYNCTPGTSFPVCTLETDIGSVRVGAMICADREFPEAAGQLMLNGAELIIIPNACDWDDARRMQLRTRAFENLVGVAMANYPDSCAGHSSAYHCVCWDAKGMPRDNMLVEAGGQQEGIYMATFNLAEIREFRRMEQWRLDYRKGFTAPRENQMR